VYQKAIAEHTIPSKPTTLQYPFWFSVMVEMMQPSYGFANSFPVWHNAPMPSRKKDSNQKAAKHVAKVTKTKRPKGEDLLGSAEALAELAKARKRLRLKR
jgi:hypothetical protein